MKTMEIYRAIEPETPTPEGRLEEAKRRFGRSLKNPQLSQEEYVDRLCSFINAYQKANFDEGPRQQFVSINQMGSILSEQVSQITGHHGHRFDVNERIQGYFDDEGSQDLRSRGLPESVTPRVVTMTLADMVDDHLPTEITRRWTGA